MKVGIRRAESLETDYLGLYNGAAARYSGV
jgi:hypothetical protein